MTSTEGIYYPFLDNEKDSFSSSTLDIKHEQVLEHYQERKNGLSSLKENFTTINNKLSKFENKSIANISERERLERETLLKKQRKLAQEIQDIENDQTQNNYYLDTLDHLINYYDQSNQKNKADIYDKYLSTVDPRYMNYHSQSRREPYFLCVDCDTPMSLNASLGHAVCLKCGLTEGIVLEESRITYNNGVPSQETSCFTYKKVTHFKERTQQCQGKERTTIPDEVIQGIRDKIKAERILDLEKINVKKIKQYLKELGFATYYEHANFILSKITGKLAPEIPPEVDTQLNNMFNEINNAFKRCCPVDRKNFLSYNFVLHKCIQLIGTCDYLLPYFPLLKSKQKLQTMDQIWEEICKMLNWQFIPSN